VGQQLALWELWESLPEAGAFPLQLRTHAMSGEAGKLPRIGTAFFTPPRIGNLMSWLCIL